MSSDVCSKLFPLLFDCRLLDRAPSGAPFISLCFIVRSIDALGFAAAMTSAFSMTAKIFPNNVATVLVRADLPLSVWYAAETLEFWENRKAQ